MQREKKKENKNKKSSPGVLERRRVGLAGREKPTGEEQLANRASFIHFSFFVLLPGVLCFLLPDSTTHRHLRVFHLRVGKFYVAQVSWTTVDLGWGGGGGVNHCNPLDEQHPSR